MESCPINQSKPFTVAVFAYNEQERVVDCLESLPAAAGGRPLEIYVLVNGCTDQTETVVAEHAKSHPFVHLVRIDLPDKSNAWNEYVHGLRLEREIHIFIDGDVRACRGALIELESSLRDASGACAAAALPVTGRSVVQWRKRMVEKSEIAGNLYALRGSFVDRIRKDRVCIPTGFIGDDSLVAFMVRRNLNVVGGDDPKRIVACEAAGFSFDPLVWWRPNHLWGYWKKQKRYKKREDQFLRLRTILNSQNFAGMPDHADQLYP